MPQFGLLLVIFLSECLSPFDTTYDFIPPQPLCSLTIPPSLSLRPPTWHHFSLPKLFLSFSLLLSHLSTCSTHPIPVLLSVEWAGWPGNTKNHSSSESFLLPAIYIMKKKRKERKKDRNMRCYLSPVAAQWGGSSAGSNAHAKAHAGKHLQVCTTIASKSDNIPMLHTHTIASLSVV